MKLTTLKLRLAPRRLAGLALAVAAVPGVAPVSAPMIPAPAPGGWIRQNPEAPDVRHATAFADTVLGREFGHPYVVERIFRADSQVVGGVSYRIRMRVAEVDDSILGERKECVVAVWSRPWLKTADVLTSFDCQALDAVDLDG